MKVSVIVPTFNRRLSLLRCVERIPPGVEVVVVDDGSTDGTSEAVTTLKRSGLVYVRQANAGPASTRNAGVRVAKGKFVAFTDDDCVPVGPWPWPLVARLEREHHNLGGAGGRVLPAEDGLFSRYYTHHRILEPPVSRAYLVTANCAFVRSILLEVGGFDTGITEAGGEDPGLSMKVRAAGYDLAYEPFAVVRHHYRESLWDFARTFYRYGKGCGYVMG